MKNKKAFTIVEFMVVVAIIGLLVAIPTPSLRKVHETARARGMQEKDITLFARVISVAESGGGASISTSMAALLQVEEKPDYVLAVADYKHFSKVARAKAILKSAIASGGIVERLAELKGHYNENGEFVIKSLKANGLEVEF